MGTVAVVGTNALKGGIGGGKGGMVPSWKSGEGTESK